MHEEELTPIEQSRAATGFRYYALHTEVYVGLASAVDQARGYPVVGTLRGLPPVQELQTATDGSGMLVIAIHCWRFTAADDAMLADPIAAGLVTELTAEEYQSLKPEPEPEP